ncbi:hypothetical protein IFR05_011536 [Cadophora sp. M221]|nr:hypothetical protein IFR05_011536 [Cadophora sp. M221]
MSAYHHSRLSLGPDSIRMLRLKPCKDQSTAKIHCELFDYNLQDPSQRTHLYDALSYVWGNPKVTVPIYVGEREHELPVTINLYAALLRLRNCSLERIIWIDAICIDQKNDEEKAQQIQLMAKIYSQACRVLVWLGVAADNSDQALEEIRAAGRKATHSCNNDTMQLLLERDWFKRIWILQEVAAARHVLIMCGPTEIDGYAFCLGIDSLKSFFETRADLRTLIQSVTYLIRGAIFRTGTLPQAICKLGELIDMYHNHEATLPHDRVYALLGMSGMESKDLRNAKMVPDYGDKWEELLQRLAKFLLSDKISVEACSDKGIASIKSKGCILGRISSVQNTISLDGRQGVDINFKKIPGQLDYKEEWSAHWILQPSAKSIQDGDLVCLLEGASNPTIIRLRKNYFLIVMIAASPLETGQSESGDIKWPWPKLFARDFLLLWDWVGEYEALVRTNGWESGHLKKELGGDLDNATRTWNVAMILDDLGEFEKADEMLREAINGYEIAFKQEHLYTPKVQCGRAPLSWAAGNGYNTVVDQLLTKDGMDSNLKDSQSGRTPLSWAAKNGHEAVVKLLLETGKIEVNSKDNSGYTPLSRAAKNGHEAVVKLLLKTNKVEVNSKDNKNRTPLFRAVKNGHEVIVKLLLKTSKVEVNSKDKRGQTPLFRATENGNEAIVKLLLESSKVEVNSKDNSDYTPLSRAAGNGHEAVVKLLLETGKVEVNSKNERGQTPLFRAAENGNEAIVKLLLETGKVEVNSKDERGQTPLFRAAENGNEAIVKLLLETSKVEVDSEDKYSQTPLSQAFKNRHEAIIKLLLDTGKVKVDSKDERGRTLLSRAAENGHEAIVKLLLETSKVEVNSKDNKNRTPLFRAVKNGHEVIVKLLLKTGKVEVNSKDNSGYTPLSRAAENGNKAIVKLLLESSKVEVNSKDNSGYTPLSRAAGNGHDAVVKLLLETGKVEVYLKVRSDGRTPLL